MRRLRAIILLLFLLGLFTGAAGVNAQTYLFQVPREIVTVFVNDDGTLSIEISPGSYLKIEKSAISMDWTAALNKPTVTDKK